MKKNTNNKPAQFYPITFKRIWECFTDKRRYIGIDWNLFGEGHEGYRLIEEFLNFVAREANPYYLPHWFLNLLHLYGNDNSIVRCRNLTISNWHRKLTHGIMIRDIKEKWGTLRIYGSFTQKIQNKLEILEKEIEPMLQPY